jgi:hypothetical protein
MASYARQITIAVFFAKPKGKFQAINRDVDRYRNFDISKDGNSP